MDFAEDDDLIALYVQSAREWCEQFLGRALALQTLRWTVADAAPPVGQVYLNPSLIIYPQWLTVSSLLRRPLELPRSPVEAVLSVSSGPYGAEVALDPSTYTLDSTEPARLRLPMSGGAPGGNVQVVFKAGFADPTMVPRSVVNAILLLTSSLYENRGDAGGEMPDVAARLLWPYRILSFGG